MINNAKNYDQVWTERFNFFQQNGAPNTLAFKEAYKGLDFMKKLRVNMNFYAFFFGFIYFLIKGMWKGALTLLLIWPIIAFISYKFPIMGMPLGFVYAFLGGMTANYTFYRKEMLGEDDFNIFKGMRL